MKTRRKIQEARALEMLIAALDVVVALLCHSAAYFSLPFSTVHSGATLSFAPPQQPDCRCCIGAIHISPDKMTSIGYCMIYWIAVNVMTVCSYGMKHALYSALYIILVSYAAPVHTSSVLLHCIC